MFLSLSQNTYTFRWSIQNCLWFWNHFWFWWLSICMTSFAVQFIIEFIWEGFFTSRAFKSFQSALMFPHMTFQIELCWHNFIANVTLKLECAPLKDEDWWSCLNIWTSTWKWIINTYTMVISMFSLKLLPKLSKITQTQSINKLIRLDNWYKLTIFRLLQIDSFALRYSFGLFDSSVYSTLYF